MTRALSTRLITQMARTGTTKDIAAPSRDGSNYWRSTVARADKDSSRRGGTHAYRYTSSERRTGVFIDRREWVRSRNTKNAYGGYDRKKGHGGTMSHEHLKNSRVHESRNGDGKRRDHSMSYDSDGSTTNTGTKASHHHPLLFRCRGAKQSRRASHARTASRDVRETPTGFPALTGTP